MKKTPTVYQRTADRRHVTDEVTPGCEWVLAGEGTPTRKIDGVCVMLDADGQWWARREVKPGKTSPPGFVESEHDDVTGKTVGWEPIAQSSFVKFWAEALSSGIDFQPGTYELIGPKINGNPEKRDIHLLVNHGSPGLWVLDEVGIVDYASEPPAALIAMAREQGWEGIVWHHPDGRMAKLKVRDYPTPGS